MKLSRRQFVASSSAALAASQIATGENPSANDRLIGALIGSGGMGRANLRDFLRMKDVHIAAICDVWEHNRNVGIEMTASQPKGKAEGYSDFRRILDRKDIDFVIVATPDHWHAIPTVMACSAGKDVYVEKPLSHNIYEGRQMVNAARENKRIVQMGTQQRSGAHYQAAVKLIREGKIGRISRVAAWNHENESPNGIGNPPDTTPPAGLDWDFYLGPAPKAAFNPNRFIGTFRWFWDYSGGKMTDWGTHHLDIVQWAMNVTAPVSVCAFGGNYVLNDNRETPDTLEAVLEYPNFIATYSNRVGNSRDPVMWGYGIEFYGTDGTLFIDRGGFQIFPERNGQFEEPTPLYISQIKEAENRSEPTWKSTTQIKTGRVSSLEGDGSEQHIAHVRNFLDCVKSREKPVSDVETGHYSTTATHLCNISLRVGRRIYWDSEKEAVIQDKEANTLVKREFREPWTL